MCVSRNLTQRQYTTARECDYLTAVYVHKVLYQCNTFFLHLASLPYVYTLFTSPSPFSSTGILYLARPLARKIEVLVVEVVRDFIKQTVNSFGGPVEAWIWNGDTTESAALPNELEWPIEAGSFHRS